MGESGRGFSGFCSWSVGVVSVSVVWGFFFGGSWSWGGDV